MKISTVKRNICSDGELLTLADCEQYQEAEGIVDYLSAKKFTVDKLTIVADNLRYFEEVIGPRNTIMAFLRGTGRGAILGLFFGFIFGLFDVVGPIITAFASSFWGMLLGAILGSIVEVFSFWLSGGTREFETISFVQASNYKVAVIRANWEQAYELLKESPYLPYIETQDRITPASTVVASVG